MITGQIKNQIDQICIKIFDGIPALESLLKSDQSDLSDLSDQSDPSDPSDPSEMSDPSEKSDRSETPKKEGGQP